MISKAMIKFWSKFHFKILLWFHWTAEKVTKIKLVIVMVKLFDKWRYLFNLHIVGYSFVSSWLRFNHAEYKGSLTEPIKFLP